jgi:hypothetical protein
VELPHPQSSVPCNHLGDSNSDEPLSSKGAQ